MNKETALLVCFGLGGDSVEYAAIIRENSTSRTTSSGYGTPDKPHAALGVPNGTPAINKIPAVQTREGVHLAIAGPMVDCDLDPGTVSRAGKITGIFADAVTSEPGNAYGALIRHHNATLGAQKYGSLDCVALDIYIALWRDVGAIIGTMQNDKFVPNQE